MRQYCRFFALSVLLGSTLLLPAQSAIVVDILPAPPKCGGSPTGYFRLQPKKAKPPLRYAWRCMGCNGAGNGSFDAFPLSVDIENLSAGQYKFTFTDATGSSVEQTVELIQPTPIVARVVAEGDKCLGQNFGRISVESIGGGHPPYQFAFNGGLPDQQRRWNNLASGQYFLDIIDSVGCIHKEGIVLPLGVAFEFGLGKDTTIFSGDTLLITPEASNRLKNIHWNPKEFVRENRDGSIALFPLLTTTFQAVATDIYQCDATERLTVRVRNKRVIYAPNVFAPTKATNPQNGVFYLSANGGVATIEYLRIFDRDGRMWFDGRRLLPDTPAEGWRGDDGGTEAPAGVYIWVAELRYTNGRTDVLTGEVSLLR
jgi:hypothetical protein